MADMPASASRTARPAACLQRTLQDTDERSAVGGVQAQVQKFQDSPHIPVMLLTTQVGGLGLTLTAATRVIIIGVPSGWHE